MLIIGPIRDLKKLVLFKELINKYKENNQEVYQLKELKKESSDTQYFHLKSDARDDPSVHN